MGRPQALAAAAPPAGGGRRKVTGRCDGIWATELAGGLAVWRAW